MHIQLLKKMGKQANNVYKLMAPLIVRDIIKELNRERLTKSDQMPKGWTKNISKIEVDLSGMVENVLDKYIGGLRWTLFGKAAGKKAEEYAKLLKIKGLTVPGIVYSSYLNGLDIHNQHMFDVTGLDVNFPKGVMKASLDMIKEKSGGFADDFFSKLTKDLVDSLLKVVDLVNSEHMNKVLRDAHEDSDLTYRGAIEEYGDANLKLPKEVTIESLIEVLDNNKKNWSMLAESQMGTASGVAAHQAMHEIYGKKDDGLRIVLFAIEDEKLCKTCDKWSKPDGKNYKYYSIDDFKPAGWNFGRKKENWELCMGAQHFNCRCVQLYIPFGMKVNEFGILYNE